MLICTLGIASGEGGGGALTWLLLCALGCIAGVSVFPSYALIKDRLVSFPWAYCGCLFVFIKGVELTLYQHLPRCRRTNNATPTMLPLQHQHQLRPNPLPNRNCTVVIPRARSVEWEEVSVARLQWELRWVVAV